MYPAPFHEQSIGCAVKAELGTLLHNIVVPPIDLSEITSGVNRDVVTINIFMNVTMSVYQGKAETYSEGVVIKICVHAQRNTKCEVDIFHGFNCIQFYD